VSKVTSYGTEETRVRQGRNFSLRHRIQRGSGGTPSVLCSRGLFHQEKGSAEREGQLTAHHHLVPKSRMRGDMLKAVYSSEELVATYV
jgi:hypothetical protein